MLAGHVPSAVPTAAETQELQAAQAARATAAPVQGRLVVQGLRQPMETLERREARDKVVAEVVVRRRLLCAPEDRWFQPAQAAVPEGAVVAAGKGGLAARAEARASHW
ncbi:MAG: hypothetical protein H6717_37695 [Polyangiaceae bacterium]|nr:hypothetical protein [Polyangiaceae bacterium]